MKIKAFFGELTFRLLEAVMLTFSQWTWG